MSNQKIRASDIQVPDPVWSPKQRQTVKEKSQNIADNQIGNNLRTESI
jgi:hypothetical protein